MTGARRFALLLGLQMLPATMLTPAVRPLFASQHAGREGAMHAFFALAMAGAILGTPLVVRKRPPLRTLILLDLVLLAVLPLHLPTALVLALRFLEGAAHVGTTTCLMALAAEHARREGCARTIPAAAAAIGVAVALGSALGGLAVHVGGPRAVFGVAAGLLVVVALLAPAQAPSPTTTRRAPLDPTAFASAFLGRFLVGCLVVTFALFAHRVHHVSDARIGALFAAVTVPFALASYPLGRLAGRGNADGLAFFGSIAAGAGLLSLGYCSTLLLPLPMIVFGLGGSALFASAVERSSAGHGDRARAMGALQVAGCAGMLLGPIVAGVVAALTRSAVDPARAPRAVFLLGAGVSVAFALFCRVRARALLDRGACPSVSPTT
ncbi:MAG: MFS transporter [Myxococcales bacterium]|nr:MFS transporter [Myxococcales bacterium]